MAGSIPVRHPRLSLRGVLLVMNQEVVSIVASERPAIFRSFTFRVPLTGAPSESFKAALEASGFQNDLPFGEQDDLTSDAHRVILAFSKADGTRWGSAMFLPPHLLLQKNGEGYGAIDQAVEQLLKNHPWLNRAELDSAFVQYFTYSI